MSSLPARRSEYPYANMGARILAILLLLFLPVVVLGQGSGRDSTGTGGNHVIQGKIFFPSGRRAEGTIQIKLESNASGELSTIADSNGSLIFTSLAPGNYTGSAIRGREYEL